MYILTGGAGFIGSVFLKTLNDAGIDDILVVDHLGQSEKWTNLRGKKFADYEDKKDFHSRLSAGRLPLGIKGIIHLGACSSTTERDADYLMHNNFGYTKALATWGLEKGVRFIYASSGAVYGDGSLGFSDDDATTPLLKPLNMYGYSKQSFDEWAIRTGAAKKIVGIRFFNVYGPNEYHKGDMASVIFKSYNQIKKSGRIELFKSMNPNYKDGEQRRDFIYVKDCCSVLLKLLEEKAVAGIFNLGTGKSRTWSDLAAAVFSAMGVKQDVRYIDMPPGLAEKYQYLTEAKTEKLTAALPNLGFTTLEEGVKDYVSHLSMADSYL